MNSSAQHVTQLLIRAGHGEEGAREELYPLVHDQLHRLAERLLSSERRGHTLQATAIVHDAYMQLVDSKVDWSCRRQFYAIAGAAMRQLLASYARQRRRLKRGGGIQRVTLGDVRADSAPEELDLLQLDGALDRLRERWSHMADIVEQRFFCGLTVAETAEVLGLAQRTVERDWRFARAWLRRQIGGDEEV